MPRIRYIKSEFWKDEDIAELPYRTRLFYIGMWNFADKAGRLEDRPKWLKVEIFPYENVDTEELLKELSKPKKNSSRPFIQRYSIDYKRYIQILSWDEHQKPHHQEQESKIPKPPTLIETLTVNGNWNGECSSNKLGEDEPNKHRTSTEDIKKKQVLKVFDFESVWLKYPEGKKQGKKEAIGYFNATVKTDVNYLNINKALDNYVKYIQKEGMQAKYIQKGCNWFDDWESWVSYYDSKEAPKYKPANPDCKVCNATGFIFVPATSETKICKCRVK